MVGRGPGQRGGPSEQTDGTSFLADAFINSVPPPSGFRSPDTEHRRRSRFVHAASMTPSARTLLLGALVLCALGDAAPTPRGHCAGNRCFALFQDPEDFDGARKGCRVSGGDLVDLVDVVDERVLEILSVHGSYWVSRNDTPAETTAGLQSCPIVSSDTGGYKPLWEPCTGTRRGYLCAYQIAEPCMGLQAGGGAHVNYTTPMGFRADGSETFPPGTIAVAVEVGGTFANSKHVCFSADWIRAPWTCEVLGGGCEHNCSSEPKTCFCPAGKILHRNKISCTADPCESNPCMGEGEECRNTKEGFQCVCRDGFVEEDGDCVDVTICERCEHMTCQKFNSVYRCTCREGFRSAAHDPTKCEVVCTEKDCPAMCDRNNQDLCYCPEGYIKVKHGGETICTAISDCEEQCDHRCETLSGGGRCVCHEGFKLHEDMATCVPITEEEEEGSGATPLPLLPNPGSSGPPAVSSYMKTGSVLGISVLAALCAALMYLLIRSAARRCGRLQISSIKRQDMDIFYLQQVTSETYKRLSLDTQSRSNF